MGFLPKIPFISKQASSNVQAPNPDDKVIGIDNQTLTQKKRKQKLHSPKYQQTKKDSSRIKITTINNQTVRMFPYEGQQYYCVDDLAKASKMANPEQFLKDFLTKNPEINSELAEVETEENGKNTTLQFATKEQITPIIDAFEKVSPKTITFSIKSLN